jgi:hypothetical protein
VVSIADIVDFLAFVGLQALSDVWNPPGHPLPDMIVGEGGS